MKMETVKLFNVDAYLKEFEAKILDIFDNRIILDKTAFYPESGGQPFDTGFIDNKNVISTTIDKSSSEIIHTVDNTDGLSVGDKVICKINWERRYKFMRLHSALHVLYIVFNEKYPGYKLRGSAIEENKARLDIEFFDLINLEYLNHRINEIITLDLNIRTYSDFENDYYRYWEIEKFPIIPCGGTHVKSTSEIGNTLCKIKSKGKQGQRIYITIE